MSKILIISQHYFPENFRVTDIAEELVKNGHDVTVLCGYPNYPNGDIYEGYYGKGKKIHQNEVINGVKVQRCYEHPRKKSKLHLFLNYYSVSLSMKKKARKMKEKFDIVLINQLSPVMQSFAGITYAKKHKVPVLLYCYDLWPSSLTIGGIKKDSLIYKYFHRVSNKIYQNVDKILVTSKNFINYFEEVHKINKNKIAYLPQYCEDMYKELNYSKNSMENNFVFAGNIGNAQDVDTIILAANEIKEHKDIKIHFVGDGAKLNYCQKLSEKLKLDNIVFHGRKPLDQMPQYYNLADAMIVSLSKSEIGERTLPGKVQSYMAAGKPIISSADGETMNIVKEAKCGIAIEAENYHMLAQAFIEMSKCDKIEFIKNSRKYYETHFEKNVFFAKLEQAMEELINGYIQG